MFFATEESQRCVFELSGIESSIFNQLYRISPAVGETRDELGKSLAAAFCELVARYEKSHGGNPRVRQALRELLPCVDELVRLDGEVGPVPGDCCPKCAKPLSPLAGLKFQPNLAWVRRCEACEHGVWSRFAVLREVVGLL